MKIPFCQRTGIYLKSQRNSRTEKIILEINVKVVLTANFQKQEKGLLERKKY
jgi:hypothetical protein